MALAVQDSYKVVFLGPSNSGKTNIVSRLVDGTFTHEKPTASAAVQFHTKEVFISKLNKTVNVQIYDTSGNERYSKMLPVYLRDAAAIAIVVDISDKDSIDKAKTYAEIVRSSAKPTSPILLIANKVDLTRHISTEDGEWLSRELGCAHYIETSPRKNINIAEMFTKLAQLMIYGPSLSRPQSLLSDASATSTTSNSYAASSSPSPTPSNPSSDVQSATTLPAAGTDSWKASRPSSTGGGRSDNTTPAGPLLGRRTSVRVSEGPLGSSE